MKKEKLPVEYDLHPRGMRVDDALARLERIVSAERARGGGVFALVTGYGASGGTTARSAGLLRPLLFVVALPFVIIGAVLITIAPAR